jgi:hypothetical protein
MATLPFTFTPDTVADATQVNANFQSVANPPGPLGVGVNPPANANPGRIFATGGITLDAATVPPNLTDRVGHFMVNLYVDTAGTFRYLNNGMGFELNCDMTTQTWVLRQAPSGTAGAAVASFQRTVTFQPGLIALDPLASDIGGTPGDQIGHYMVNAQYSATANNFVYVVGGLPAFDYVCDASTGIMVFRQAPAGAAGAVIVWQRVFSLTMAPAAGASSVQLLWNNAGVLTLQNVLVGAADSAGAGFRQLRIPN